jgi:hypothetical protein
MSNTIPEEDLTLFKDNGYFTLRRTHKFWSGVWTDMTIEQVLMRSMKTTGGLTRGHGMTNITISEWIHGTHLCIPLCEALEDFTSKCIDFSEHMKYTRIIKPFVGLLQIVMLLTWISS